MILIACVDDGYGMMFNERRQSRDAVLRSHMLAQADGRPLWMSPYSRKMFSEIAEGEEGPVFAAEDFSRQAASGEFCFVEDPALFPAMEDIEKILLYRWNRSYPADAFFPFSLDGWTLSRTEEFPGSSHETITMEEYER